MGLLFLSVFIAVPLIEIGLFIEVGGAIGLWPTILVVISTAIAGTALLRHQGLGALNRLQDSLNKGEPLIGPIFDGFCLLAAGVLLLTPGFFTDTLGFLLFVPAVRRALGRLLAARLQVPFSHPHTPASGGVVIDGEWRDITDPPDKIKPGSHSSKPGGKRDIHHRSRLDVSNDN